MTRNSEKAMSLYLQALERDAGNLGARVNYARLLTWHKDNDADLAKAIRMLESVAEATREKPREATRYAALYALAVARFDLGSNKMKSDAGEGRTLRRSALGTASELKEAVREGRDGRAEGNPINPLSWLGHRKLQEYCEALYPGVEALWVGLNLVCSGPPSTDESVAQTRSEVIGQLRRYLRERRETGDSLPARALYNRACTLSIAARMAHQEKLPDIEPGEDKHDKKGEGGTFVGKMTSTARSLLGTSSADGELELTEQNLVDGAFWYLEEALRKNPRIATRDEADPGGSLMNKDRSLEFLRTERKTLYQKLEEPYLVTEASTPAKALGLAELDAISGETAAQLGNLGIDTWSALFLRVATPQARTELAGEIGITEGTLVQWARLLDLLRIAELSVEDVNLLEKTQIHSRQQLESVDPDELAVLLQDRAGGQPELVPPERAEVRGWWIEARKDPSLVVL